MNIETKPTPILLRIEDGESDRHSIDAPTLIHTIEALQQAVYIAAMDCSDREVRERARIPGDIARRYTLECSAPEAGSYAQPMVLGALLLDTEDTALMPQVVSLVDNAFRAVAERDVAYLKSMFRYEELRKRMVEALRGIVPRAGSTHRVFLRMGAGKEHRITSTNGVVFAELKRHREREESYLTVTGRLHSIDFSESRIRIYYPVNQRELECTYDPAVEELLLENPRDWIQVSGTVVLGQDGEPVKILGVDNISELDLSEIEIQEISLGDKVLRFHMPISIKPQCTESKQMLYAVDERLGIDVYASTREELVNLLSAQIEFLWLEYAQEQESALSEAARKMRLALRESAELVEI